MFSLCRPVQQPFQSLPPPHLLLELHPGETAKLEEVDGLLFARQHRVVVLLQLFLGCQLLPLVGLYRHSTKHCQCSLVCCLHIHNQTHPHSHSHTHSLSLSLTHTRAHLAPMKTEFSLSLSYFFLCILT